MRRQSLANSCSSVANVVVARLSKRLSRLAGLKERGRSVRVPSLNHSGKPR
ncbi:hypothetical protein D3C78_1786220 [compost metagenome]